MPKRKISSIDKSLGRNLTFFRKLEGLTQQQMADRLNINRTTYTKYETGDSEPSIEILKRIADVLDVNVSLLVSDESPLDSVSVADAMEFSSTLHGKVGVLRRQIAQLSPEELKQLNDELAEAGVMFFEK